MRQTTEFKTCDECKGPCQLLQSPSRPVSSEWYCAKCHKSYPVFEDDGQDEVNPDQSSLAR